MVQRAVVEIVASGDALLGVDIRPGKPRLFSSRPNRALVPIGCFDTPPSPSCRLYLTLNNQLRSFSKSPILFLEGLFQSLCS